jgi:hypothetical protein
MTAVKRPAFQFYPRDWLTDSRLRACSPAARGLWADLLCVMHELDPYGHLARDGRPIPDAAVARQVGESLGSYRRLLKEIESHGVSSRTADGILYSRRMVRDERVRRVRALGGSLSANNPNVPRAREEDGGEGYLSDAERVGGKVPSEGSPSSSSSSAVAVASTTTAAPHRSELLARIAREPGRADVVAFLESLPKDQSEIAWLRILIGCLGGLGMPGQVPATTGALATACREYPALLKGSHSPRLFKACVADAMRSALAHAPKVGAAQSKTDRALASAARWAAKDSA